MKPIELLKNNKASEKVLELLEGANKLKDAKKYFESMERTLEYFDEMHKKEFWEHIDDIDTKLLETIEEVNRSIAFLIHCQLDNEIND